MKTSGTVVVLGAGVGRESIALAQRGLRVIGLDINYEALHLASHTAQFKPVDVTFIQANFLELPLLPTQIDYLLLSGIMYSSVRKLCTHLKTGGLALVNFYIDPAWRTGSSQLTPKLRPWLASLPGANAEYQPGDLLSNGHFLHTFLSEDELRSEFIETGATIVHLDWEKQFAVLAWSS
jgi:2-polyprenyl-3-methyl-5-hydroxy-6-metoxy-1,4-benzoquinol methylase